MNSKSMINDLTEGPLTKQLLSFIAPFMLSNLMQTLYNMVDMAVVGQFCGSAGLSAVTIGGHLLDCFTFLCMGLTAASQIIIAQHIGSGDREGVSRAIGTGFSFVLLFSLFTTVLGLSCSKLFLRWLNTPDVAWEYAMDYCVVCYCGLFFIYGYNVVSAILRGMGESKKPFLFICIAACINTVLDLLFVGVLKMGAFGAALATVIGQGASFIFSLVYLYRRRVSFGFDFKPKSFKIDPRQLKMLLKLGFPLIVQHLAVNITIMYVSSFINAYGVAYSAVSGVGFKINRIVNIVTQATSGGGSSIIGQNFGAGKFSRVKRIVYTELIMCFIFASILAIIIITAPRFVFGLFTDDSAVLDLAPMYVPYSVMFFYGASLRSPFMGFINGLGNSRFAMFGGIMDGVVARLGLALGLGILAGMGITGFWLGDALAGFTIGIIGAIYFFFSKWQERKLIIN